MNGRKGAVPASQDYRDGASTGAAIVAERVARLLAWGVKIDAATLGELAKAVSHEYGGTIDFDGVRSAVSYKAGT